MPLWRTWIAKSSMLGGSRGRAMGAWYTVAIEASG